MPTPTLEKFSEDVFKSMEESNNRENYYLSEFYSALAKTDCASEKIEKTADKIIGELERRMTINPEQRNKSLKQIRQDAKKLSRFVEQRGTAEFSKNVVRSYVGQRAAGKRCGTSKNFVNMCKKTTIS